MSQRAQLEAEFSNAISGLSGLLASTLANPEQWLLEALGGSESTAGVRINYHTALTVAYVWAAQQLIAGDVAKLPFDTKVREADDDLVLDRTQPAWFVMNRDFNGNMSSLEGRQLLTHWALLLGDGMGYILRDAMNRPSAILPAIPGDLTPVRALDDRGRPILNYDSHAGGPAAYWNRETGAVFLPRDILHIKGLGNDLGGHPLTRIAKNSLGLMLAVEKHGSDYFKRGGTPRIVLTTPTQLDEADAARYAEAFEKRHSEGNKPAIMQGKWELEKLPADNEGAQWDEARTRAIVEVAAWYGMPPYKLGDATRVGYNGVSAENQAYVTHCLDRWLSRWRAETMRKFLPPRAYRNATVEYSHDTSVLIDTDEAARTDTVVKQKDAMIISKEEARRKLGYTRNAPEGDTFENANTSTGAVPAADESTADPDQATAADALAPRPPFVALVTSQLDVMAGTMTDQANRRLKRGSAFPEDWSASWQQRTSSYLGPALEATAAGGFATMELDQINDVIGDWTATAEAGGVLSPSPGELAEQIVGEAACTN